MIYDQAMLSALKDADNFMLCAHINPDGDAIGSMLAACRLLRKMGKQAIPVVVGPVPPKLTWLPDVDWLMPVEQAAGLRFDAALCVDACETKRMGPAYEIYRQAGRRFVIDHHPGQTDFAQHSLVDPSAAAVGELIVALWEEMGEKLDREAAAQLYAAISTDTGNFLFNSVTARTFECMEKLMETGLDVSEPARRLFLTQRRAAIAAQTRALASLKYFAGGRATCMHLSLADKQAAQAQDGDLHGMVNQGLYIDGVEMTFMADETADGWKISLRALPGRDVAAIAQRFGGGGHKLAAGCGLDGSYEQVEARLMAAVEEALQA